MYYPTLTPEESSRDFIEVFGGYNHNLRIGDNEFFDMKNMSSSCYPLLATRAKRGEAKESDIDTSDNSDIAGAYYRSAFYCFRRLQNGFNLLKNGEVIWNRILPQTDHARRQLILMGAYLIILPDRLYINTEDFDDYGSIDAETTTSHDVTVRACTADGVPITFDYIGVNPPSNPMDGDIWLDLSDKKPIYKKYFSTQATWQPVIANYVLLTCEDIDSSLFSDRDGIKVSGFADERLSDLNGTSVIYKIVDNGIVFSTILDMNSVEGDTDEDEITEFPIKSSSYNGQNDTTQAVVLCKKQYEANAFQHKGFTNSYIGNNPLICVESEPTSDNQDSATVSEYPYIVVLTISGALLRGKKDNSIYEVKDYSYFNIITVEEPITISRKMPEMDFVIESKNRLWGCRYGTNSEGKIVNEIYASKLGDFKNWYCYEGLSTDSYAASCGTDGEWTGAINYLGSPVFFKENYIHTIFGSYPSQYQINSVVARGVKKGCGDSLAIVNETLFYLSNTGICTYNGSLPAEISAAFGGVRYAEGKACAFDGKYYISMKDSSDKSVLMVFDTKRGLWHKEDDLEVLQFCAVDDDIYYISVDNKLKSLFGSGGIDLSPIPWYVVTGEYGLSQIDRKYISRLNIRLSLNVGSRVEVFIQYDSSGVWQKLCNIVGRNLRPFTLPIKPKRCDHFRLKLQGSGDAWIYSVSKTTIQGSDL